MKYSSRNNQNGGFIEFIVAIIIALVLLHFLGIDLASLLQKQWVINFAIYVKDLLIIVWNDLLLIFQFIKGIAS